MSTYDVTVQCPRCDTEIAVELCVNGGYRPARGPSYSSGGEPAEHLEIDFAVPTACTHTPDAETEFTPGPYTDEEKKALETAIETAALVAVESAAFDPVWDGPEDDQC